MRLLPEVFNLMLHILANCVGHWDHTHGNSPVLMLTIWYHLAVLDENTTHSVTF